MAWVTQRGRNAPTDHVANLQLEAFSEGSVPTEPFFLRTFRFSVQKPEFLSQLA